MQKSKEVHLQAAYRILHYLKETSGKEIILKKKNGLFLEVYIDANYAVSLVHIRFTSGYCIFLKGNLVTWRNKKQNIVNRSSEESEFKAMTQRMCKFIQLKMILENMKVQLDGLIRLYCSNKSTINIVQNSVQYDNIKHIEVDRYLIKEKLDNGNMHLIYV